MVEQDQLSVNEKDARADRVLSTVMDALWDCDDLPPALTELVQFVVNDNSQAAPPPPSSSS